MPVRSRKISRKKVKAPEGQEKETGLKRELRVEEGKASVNYTISITKNLGDYESLKIQAGITIPYGASDELLAELDELMVVSREKVVNRLSKDIDDITNSLT